MLSFVTGGTGFVGAHVVRALLERGDDVRCLVRPGSRRDNLAGLPVDLVEGDVVQPAGLADAVRGCDLLFHCAADYRLDARNPDDLYAVNVDGTRNVLRAATRAGVGRIVHTSSVGALGRSGEGPAHEETPVAYSEMIGHYKRSKYLAERVATAAVAAGAPVVIVNPSTPVGELDIKPTPTGRIIVDFLRGRLPAYVDTGLNLIDVRDVAVGHLLAADRGRVGERYILGAGNLTLHEMLLKLAALTDLPPPRVRLPHWVPWLAAVTGRAWSRASGNPPRVSLEGVRMSRHHMYFDAAKAVRELGLPQSPVEDALERAVEWFRSAGHA